MSKHENFANAQPKATEVISLYDFSGVSCRPWAEAGHICYAYDIQHPVAEERKMDLFPSGGSIHYIHADLHNPETFKELLEDFGDGGAVVGFGMAFPVCTDLSVAGSRHCLTSAPMGPNRVI